MNEWSTVVTRVKKAASKALVNHTHGAAIVTVHVVVDSNGDPLFWVVGETKLIEPTVSADSRKIAEVLRIFAS